MRIQKRAGHKLLALCLFGATFASFPLPAAAADAEAKIEPKLLNALIEGEKPFFVMFGERTPLGAAPAIKDWAARGRFVMDQLKATAARSQSGVRTYLQQRAVAYKPFWVENKVYVRKGTLELARTLAQRPEVAGIIPELVFTAPRPTAESADQAGVAWSIAKIGAPDVWNLYGNTGSGIVVANIDTGVQYNHPALVRQYRGNTGNGTFDHNGNWFDPDQVCGGTPCDRGSHGTHTMGTMIGDDGGANRIGVAPGAKWIACKACDGTLCTESALTACAEWMLAPGGDPARRPHIVNNSWAGGQADVWYRAYIQNWINAGIFPAFSIGNGLGCGSAQSPGDNPEAFASGATDIADGIDRQSARGPSPLDNEIKPDVTAPGTAVFSSVPPNLYQFWTGTSMASPHTAGAVALLWAIRPGYKGSIAATELFLKNNATMLPTTEECGGLTAGAIPNNTFGSGRIDVKRTVDAAGEVPAGKAPAVTITTPSLDGQQFNCGTPVMFSGTASDPQDGDLSRRILWVGAGIPAAERGATIYKSFKCGNPGPQIVTAKVQDSKGLKARDSIVVNIVNPGKPSAPSGLAATLSGQTVTLRWTDTSDIERGFKIYRRLRTADKLGPWLMRKRIDVPNTVTFQDTVDVPGRYRYYVKAFNAEGESTPSNIVTVDK